MSGLEWSHILYLAAAVVLDVIANVLLKYSDGFRKKLPGVAAILLVLAAFTALSFAVEGMELSLAYAIWGGFGVMATIALGWILFRQKLSVIGWIGLALMIVGMNVMKLA